MRYLAIVAALLIGSVIGAAGAWYVRVARQPAPTPVAGPADPALAAGLDSMAGRVRAVRARFERVREPLPDEEAFLRRPRTPAYREHLELADSLGVGPVSTASEIDGYAARGALVPIVDSELYTVRILEHSAPYVTPDALALLDLIGERFRNALEEEALPHYRLTVSSATRTPAFQEDLRSTNRNATTGTSSHEYGVSFDLVYTRWRYAPTAGDSLEASVPQTPVLDSLLNDRMQALGAEYSDRLFGVLARVLGDVQREGLALILLEAEQPVFHVTVARRLADR
jgi:hypothetical protein